mmetsp:Transcript_15825/g.32096  ORF Transcript_15825/g.32096 Transcript_15825/m.32096 type:complete len:245 (-) Transcript_15825:579-1313(-)
MQRLHSQNHAPEVELALRPAEESQFSDRIVQLSSCDEFGEEVEEVPVFERSHQFYDERVIVLCKDLSLQLDVLLLVQHDHRLSLHALQRIPHSGGLVPHKFHDPERPPADCPNHLQLLQLHLRVLQFDSRLQMLQHGPSDNLEEHNLVDNPEIDLRCCHHSCTPRLVVQQSSFPEVVVLPACPNIPAVFLDLDLSRFDHEKSRPDLALLDHEVALLLPDIPKCLDQSVELLFGKVPEDVHLLDH